MQIIKTELAEWLEDKFREKIDSSFSFTPTKSTYNSAAYDIRACIEQPEVIFVGECVKIPLGFHAYIGSESNSLAALILPRSGLGSTEGIVLGNLVGLIDADYQEEWLCPIWNRNTDRTIKIEPGMKIAQIVFMKVETVSEFFEVDVFSESTARTGGFNSTGNM